MSDSPSNIIVQLKIAEPTAHVLKNWMPQMKQQEGVIAHTCWNARDTVPDPPIMVPTEQYSIHQTFIKQSVAQPKQWL